MSTSALVVMARHPGAGAVKTRLARVIGADRARVLYAAFLSDIQRRFASGGARTLLWAYHPAGSDFASVVGAGARCFPQQGADLGERMLNCFQRLTSEGFRRVIMVGADVPHVRQQWLDEAEAGLATRDVVLGPSRDGGYYLVAMREAHDIFSGVVMGTGSVLHDTIEEAKRRRLRVHLLPESFDVDEASDLERLAGLLADQSDDIELPATAALIKSWR